jgi:hypothetical protein
MFADGHCPHDLTAPPRHTVFYVGWESVAVAKVSRIPLHRLSMPT